MRSPWNQSNLSIAARVGLVLLLLVAVTQTPDPVVHQEPPARLPATAIKVTPATDIALPGDRIGVVVETAARQSPTEAALLVTGRQVARSALSPIGTATFDVEVPSAGPLVLGAALYEQGDLLTEVEQAALINVTTPPSILVIANESSTFAASLRQGGWTVREITPATFSGQPELLQSSSMLVLDNVSTDDMARDSWAAIEHTVRREAMGMLVLGGPRSFSLGGYRESVLESLLPVISEPPSNEPPANVIFLIDVSGSMDQPTAIGSRLDIARQAVIDTARTLRPIDRIGLMSFAIEAQNHLALTTRANHGEAVEGSWPKIASGGTNLVPAMAAAIDGFERSSTEQDILVVLTDGYVSDADLEQLENLLAGADVEIIALIVGDTSRSDNIGEFVTTIQEYGRAVRVDNMLHLPALMRNEVEQTRPALIPGPSELAVRVPAPWLPDAQWPVIDRYLLTRPREQSQVHLVSDRGDVIVASMTVGAGKVVAVTSGFASWTTDWLQSSEWPELASGLARYLTTRESGAFDVSVDTHAALLTVDAANRPLEGTAVATVVNPSDTVTTVALEPHSPGRIAATLDLDEAGQYLVVVEDGATSTRYRFINVLGSPAQLVETDDASRPHDRTNWQLWLSVLALLSFVALLVRERWSPNSRLWLPDWSTRSRRRPC